MANKPTTAQQNRIIESLNLDKAANYSRLEYYLKQIASGRDVTFETRSDQPFAVPAQEAWDIIRAWAQDEGNLPVGDRKDLFNLRSRATKLLDYLQTNVSGKTAEAAASYQLILDQAKNKITPTFPSQDPQDYNHQKIYSLRRIQMDILQAGAIGKIYTNLEKSKILAGVPVGSRNYVLRMFAAGSQNFRYNPSNSMENFTPEKIHQLLLHTPGIKDVNSIIRLFYSNAAKEDIKNIVETIESSIHEYGEFKYQKEMEMQRNLTTFSPSLSTVSYLVNNIDIHATPAEKIKLIRSLKSQIVGSASTSHRSGNDLLVAALKSAGFPVPEDINTSVYKSLIPYLEELEVKERHLLLGSELSDHDSRLLATKKLTEEIGVGLDTPWYTKKELDQVTAKIAGNKSLQEAFDLEFAKGDAANLLVLTELSDLMGKHRDYQIYHDAISGNLWYKARDLWSLGVGNFQAAKQPLDRFTGKLWAGYNKVDDILFSPVDKLGKWWEKQQELRPWLDPLKLVSDKWVGYQTGIAIKLHAWAVGVSTSSWFSTSGFAGHIADFTEGFIKHKGDWDRAGSFFIHRKWGNTLDWAAKTFTKHKDFKGLEVSIANTLWNGFSKMAPELSAKMMAGALSNTIKTFLLGELTLGASIAIQVGWEAIKAGFGKLIEFAKGVLDGNTANLYGTIPLVLGSIFLAINTVLGGIPAALVVSYKLLKVALKMMWDLFLALLALSALVTISIIAFFTLVWYGIITPTFNIDSGAGELAINIACNLSGAEAPSESSNPRLAAGKCIFQLLDGLGINPLNKGNAVGSAFASFAAALGNPTAAAEAARSATDYLAFQCVGFDVVVSMMTGGGGSFTHAKLLDTIVPVGYKYVAGVGSCSPGDFFVDKNGDWGHTGLFVSVEGANIICLDANSDGKGLVRDEITCRWPTSRIAGCLKAN